MKNITTTFNQWAAAILAVLLISVLVGCKGLTGEVEHALEAGLGLCLYYLFGSTVGSQAKDKKVEDTTGQLIEALKNSAPVTGQVQNEAK